MIVRAAREEDVNSVLPLVARLVALHAEWEPARFGVAPEVTQMYRGWLTARCADEQGAFLVAEADGGAIVGFLVATTEANIPIYRVARYGFIHDLWVEPAYRHEGLARSMALLALERFKAIGVTQVRLDTAIDNEAARSLFARCGFRATTTEMLVEL